MFESKRKMPATQQIFSESGLGPGLSSPDGQNDLE